MPERPIIYPEARLSDGFRGSEQATSQAALVSDPEKGLSTVYEYVGSRRAMQGIVLQWNESGARVNAEARHYQGPLWRATARFPYWVGNPEVTQAEWSVSTEMLEKDIYSHPTVQVYAKDFISPDDTEKTGAGAFKNWMEEKVSDGAAESVVNFAGDDGVPHQVYIELSRGVTGYETEYQVVRRVRRAPRAFPFQRTIYRTDKVYSTSQLNFPASLGSFEQGTTPRQAVWGWRIRTQDFDIRDDQYEETLEWQLYWWSTLFYSDATNTGIFT